MVWSFTPQTTTVVKDEHHHHHQMNHHHHRINYHLLSQSKLRQQHLLRCYVRTNNLRRIQDYYRSIQNYYYQRQLILERTQQQRLPQRRSKRRHGRRRRNGDVAEKEEEEDSIHILIDCGGGGGGNGENNDDDDDDDSSCIHSNEDNVLVPHRMPLVSSSYMRNHPSNHTSPNLQHDMAHSNPGAMSSTTTTSSGPVLLPPSTTTRMVSSRIHSTTTNTTSPVQENVFATALGNFSTTAPPSPSPPNVVVIAPVYTMLDIDASINPNETLHWTILYYACFHHRYEIVKYLIDDCYASMKCTDRYHNTILHWVCHYPLSPPPPTTTTTTSHQGTCEQHVETGQSRGSHNRMNGRTRNMEHTSTLQQQLGQYIRRRTRTKIHTGRNTTTTTTSRRNSRRVNKNDDDNEDEIELLLQYIMECAPSLLLVRNNYHELPLHWLCQYGNDNLRLIRCMMYFLQTNPYFSNTKWSTHTTNENPASSNTTVSSSSLLYVRRLLQHPDQSQRTPIDVARYYHNDHMADYLQSFLLL